MRKRTRTSEPPLCTVCLELIEDEQAYVHAEVPLTGELVRSHWYHRECVTTGVRAETGG